MASPQPVPRPHRVKGTIAVMTSASSTAGPTCRLTVTHEHGRQIVVNVAEVDIDSFVAEQSP